MKRPPALKVKTERSPPPTLPLLLSLPNEYILRSIRRGGGLPLPLPQLSSLPPSLSNPHSFKSHEKTGHQLSRQCPIKLFTFSKNRYFAAVFPLTLLSPQKHRTLPNYRRGGGLPLPLHRLSPSPQTSPTSHYPIHHKNRALAFTPTPD